MHTQRLARITARLAPAAIVVVAVVSELSNLIQVVTIVTGRTLLTFGGADGRLPLTHAPQFLQADLRPGARGSLAEASFGLRLACALPTMIQIVTVLLAAVLLFGIVQRVATAAVFTPPVLRRWGILAGVLVVGGVLQGLADTFAISWIISSTSLDVSDRAKAAFLGGDYQGLGINLPSWPVPVILIGIVAASLAIAFRAGADLERQTVGVI